MIIGRKVKNVRGETYGYECGTVYRQDFVEETFLNPLLLDQGQQVPVQGIVEYAGYDAFGLGQSIIEGYEYGPVRCYWGKAAKAMLVLYASKQGTADSAICKAMGELGTSLEFWGKCSCGY